MNSTEVTNLPAFDNLFFLRRGLPQRTGEDKDFSWGDLFLLSSKFEEEIEIHRLWRSYLEMN